MLRGRKRSRIFVSLVKSCLIGLDILRHSNGFLFIAPPTPTAIGRKPIFQSMHYLTNVPSSTTLKPAFESGNRISKNALPMVLSEEDTRLGLWVVTFAASHIGMSAIRSTIISTLGKIVEGPPFTLVGRENWKLPAWWPGDGAGGNAVFPDADTAGRQIYRALYTAISFATLGSAFFAYLDAAELVLPTSSSGGYYHVLFQATAALSFGASIASLLNASPLGLMPAFQRTTTDGSSAPLPIKRDDSLKFSVRGLTRITRHPLILPVVPWGIATSVLAGGRPCDFILFSGLSLYAIAGCYAQDLRVSKQEGSVGTVFRPSSSDDGNKLQSFFAETSFIPFGAVANGRQQLDAIVQEVPWLIFIFGTIAGTYLEEAILSIISN